jgi:predicted phage-related endonuclease
LVDIEQALITLQNEAKRLETLKTDVLSRIEAEMERTGTKKIDTERLMITRVLPATTQRLDTKKLEAENPDLCARYKVPSEKKGFIRLTIKNNDPTV